MFFKGSFVKDWVDGCSEKGSPCGAQGAKMAPLSDQLSSKNGCRNSNTEKRCELVRKYRIFVIFSSDQLMNNVAEFSANCRPTRKGDIDFIR